MAFSPVITRLYGPEAFGMLGTFMAILTIVMPVAALAYPIAIVLPESDADAKGLARFSAGLAFAIAIVTALVLLAAGGSIAQILSLEAIGPFLMFIPIAMLFSAFQQILTQWLIRKKQFKITARVAVIQALVINFMKTGVGFLYPVGGALIVLATLGQMLLALLLLVGMRGRDTALPREDESTATIRELAKRHRDFPLFRAPQNAINAFSQSLPVLMLASLFGPSSAGFYSLGRTVMGVPLNLIAKSVGDVFYPRVTEAVNNKENVFRPILKTTLALAAIGIVPFTIVIALGPFLFSLVFGSEWAAAGEYARWLALWMFFGFINKPSVAAMPALGMQSWLLVYELFSTGLKVAALALGFYYFNDDLTAIALMCASGVVAYLALILKVLVRAYSGDFNG
ncbi:membrane protein involved in the export of O-antigen and teichoic acid [Gynuella sunshinyii YC6258]|uniref:Membrane protein involved in the export of O-antigen and teichoic acid n=2 Tax=Gynuella sunshinyii TaxID=1445505 RepID=A0A0C5VYJ2_9GAMM|nr:membrane protein involved in the export of O-antigen and teichoic acid [Gynuella sunshinyii YC6258]